MYCNAEIETMPRPALRELQMDRLRRTVRWAVEKSAFYKNRLEAAGISHEDLRSYDDVEKLPFTTKEDLLQQPSMNFMTMPISGSIRLRFIGEDPSILRAYTAADVGRNVEMMARCLVAGGVSRASVVQICKEYPSEFAMGVQSAAEVLGAAVILADSQKSEQMVAWLGKVGATVIAGQAHQMLRFLVAGHGCDYDVKALRIEALLSLNHTVKNNMESHMGTRFGAPVFNIYAPEELGCVGVTFDCAEKRGMHVQEDYFLAEVVNMADGTAIQDGRMGELVLTSLAFEAMPFIRYRTGQIVSMDSSSCRCGRTLVRVKTP